MKQDAVSVKNLFFSYGEGADILNDLSFSLKEGDWLAITGRSGCGKSTLLLALCNLAQKQEGVSTSGEIFIFEEMIGEYSRDKLSTTLGMVFQTSQNRLVAPTVEEEIWFGLQNICLDKEEIIRRTNEVLFDLDIVDLRHKNPQMLSGGQQQLVTLAAVIAMQPRIFLFDEVISQLDYYNRNIAIRKIKQLNSDGATIIMVDHDPKIVALAKKTIEIKGDI